VIAMVRIIAGRFRGRALRTPAGGATRPTADAMKETIYNVLGDSTRDARVADLFAGSGSLGLEALSRGARSAVFVETAPAALAVLRANIAALRLESQTLVADADALRYLSASQPDAFDVVLADPPYALGAEPMIVASARAALGPGGMLVLQHDRRGFTAEGLDGWRRLRARRFGDTVIDFLVREDANDAAENGALSGHV